MGRFASRALLEARGGVEADELAVGGADDEAAEQRGADVVRVALELDRVLESGASSSYMWSAAQRPATIAAAL